MNAFAIIRLAIFGVIFVFSLICLGISGNYVSKTSGWSFPGFALAVAILTLVIATPMLIIDILRKGAVVSWVAIELGWTGLLWVLWLASASLTTSTNLFPDGDCSLWIPQIATLCYQYSALQAFQWLTWILLFFYIILVIVLAVMASVRGNSRAWLSPVSDLSFSSTGTNSAEPKIPPPGAYGVQQPYNPNPAPGAYGGSPMQPGSYPVGYVGSHPGSPAPTGQYQTPLHTGGYGAPAAPGATGYAQPGAYGQNPQPQPNVAQV